MAPTVGDLESHAAATVVAGFALSSSNLLPPVALTKVLYCTCSNYELEYYNYTIMFLNN